MTIPSSILTLARREDGPLYIYDLAVLHDRLRLLNGLPIARKRIHFATMANDHPRILSLIGAAGHGVFVNSLTHLTAARDADLAPHRIIFAASNMSRDEMEACLAAGVHVILDSLGQVEAFDAIASRGTAVGVRVNVGSAVESAELCDEPSYRFGLLPEELAVVLGKVRNLRIVGVHSYFGTDIMAPKVLLDGLERLGRIGELLPELEYVDAGGGFGIADDPSTPPFDLAAYGRGAADIMAALETRVNRPVTLVIEPGRWLTAPIGWFFVRIVDVKERADRVFAGTNASVAQFPRLLMYPEQARHPCEVVDASDRPVSTRPVWISGNSTYSRDFLARGVRLAVPRPGDLVAFHHAGAYCRSMLTRFLGKNQPGEIVLDTSAKRIGSAPALAEAAE
ncbi:MAG: alanine racemase [Reyranella sp.]|nr:alanine racemase [Reyranella sp.]